jgi:hypothetical protein
MDIPMRGANSYGLFRCANSLEDRPELSLVSGAKSAGQACQPKSAFPTAHFPDGFSIPKTSSKICWIRRSGFCFVGLCLTPPAGLRGLQNAMFPAVREADSKR